MTDANPKMLQTCSALYIAYAACALSGFIPLWSIVILGSLALTVAVIVAYQQRPKAGDTIYASHFQWLIRTFWIGGFVYLPILTVLSVIAVYIIVDWSEVQAAIKTAALEHSSPGPDDTKVVVDTVMKDIMEKNGTKIAATVFMFIFPAIAWWLWRCWKGFRLLKAGKPVTDVMKWV